MEDKKRGSEWDILPEFLVLVWQQVEGAELSQRLAEMVRGLEEKGVSQEEARSFLKEVYYVQKRNYSAEFHRRLRAATPGATVRKTRRQLSVVQ